MDVASTLRLNKWKFIALFVVVVATLNIVALAREPDVPLYKTKALVVASELAIRVDGLPRTAVAIFNGGTVARLAANYAGTGISPDDLIPAILAEVHIKIRHGHAFHIKETLKYQAVRNGVDICDLHGVCRQAPGP